MTGFAPWSTPPLIFFPGLGADERLLARQRAAFPRLVVPAWLTPRARESLRSYAGRFAETLNIPADAVIGGVSFGGMLALEMARHIPVRGVILIASCRNPSAIGAAVRRFAGWGLRLPVLPGANRLARLALPALGPMGARERAIMLEIAQSTSLEYVRWGGRAILKWKGVRAVPCPVLQVHGDKDHIIPAANVSPDVLVHRAGHVVNLTHAAAVNGAIESFLARFST